MEWIFSASFNTSTNFFVNSLCICFSFYIFCFCIRRFNAVLLALKKTNRKLSIDFFFVNYDYLKELNIVKHKGLSVAFKKLIENKKMMWFFGVMISEKKNCILFWRNLSIKMMISHSKRVVTQDAQKPSDDWSSHHEWRVWGEAEQMGGGFSRLCLKLSTLNAAQPQRNEGDEEQNNHIETFSLSLHSQRYHLARFLPLKRMKYTHKQKKNAELVTSLEMGAKSNLKWNETQTVILFF